MSSAQEMLAAHVRGEGTRALGKRFGVSRETARKVVLQQGSTLIAKLERDLLARRTPRISIPYGPQQDLGKALLMLDWCVMRLRERGHAVEIDHRPTPHGSVFTITLGGTT